MFQKALRYVIRINQASAVLGSVVLLMMTGLVASDVVMRRFFHAPLIFADEIAGYSLVIITVLGLGFTLRQNGHIQVMVLLRYISSKHLNYLNIFWCLVGIAYTTILFITTAQLSVESYHLSAFSTTTQLPLAPFQFFCPIGCLFLIFGLITKIVESVLGIINRKERDDIL